MWTKRPVLYIGGTFDLIHPGHVNLLERCDSLGRVTVSLNRDEFAARYKRPPVQDLDQRIAVMRSIKFVTEVVVNVGDEDSRPAILQSNADFVVHGSDWTGEALFKQMGFDLDWLIDHGISMLYLDVVPDLSTTALIKRIKEGESSGESSS